MFVIENREEQNNWNSGLTAFIVFLWVLLGMAAFIMSLLCFGKSGKISHQIFGFILALLFGPFYWIYYIVTKKYCR